MFSPAKNLSPPLLRRPRFDRCTSTTEWRLLDIFYVFVLLRRITLWPWPLTFLTLRVFHVQCFSCPTHIPIFIILQLLVI